MAIATDNEIWMKHKMIYYKDLEIEIETIWQLSPHQ